MASKPAFKTDVVRRTKLDVGASSAQSNPQQQQPFQTSELSSLTSKEHLERITSDLNRSVDSHVETLANGMLDLIKLAKVSTKDKYKADQDAWQAKCRAEAMIKAAEGLLSISHSLKILFILKDDDESLSNIRKSQTDSLESFAKSQREQAVGLLQNFLSDLNTDGGNTSSSSAAKTS